MCAALRVFGLEGRLLVEAEALTARIGAMSLVRRPATVDFDELALLRVGHSESTAFALRATSFLLMSVKRNEAKKNASSTELTRQRHCFGHFSTRHRGSVEKPRTSNVRCPPGIQTEGQIACRSRSLETRILEACDTPKKALNNSKHRRHSRLRGNDEHETSCSDHP